MVSLFVVFTSIILLVFANAFVNIVLGVISLITFWSVFFAWSLRKWKEYVVLCFFLLCYFSFLIGAYLSIFSGTYAYEFPNDVEIFTIDMLYLSLVLIWTGCKTTKYIKFKFSSRGNSLDLLKTENGKFVFKKPSFILFWITFPFYLIEILNQVSYVRIYGYLEYYRTYQYVSSFVHYGSIACVFFFSLYLACFPHKRQAIFPLSAYLIANMISILGGKRTNMVVAMVFIIFYFLYRDRVGDEEIWFKRSYVKFIIIATPILMSFLGYWAYYRTDTIESGKSILDYLMGFISSNGSSGRIIGYTYQLKDTLRSLGSHSYTFGFFIRTFGGGNTALTSAAIAQSGTSLGASITSMKAAHIFNIGGGFGTCYIAELWIDFGILGVVIYNLILGMVLTKIGNLKTGDTFKLVLAFYVIQKFFILPRSEALCMITDFFSRLFLLLLVGCVLIAHMAKGNNPHKSRVQ